MKRVTFGIGFVAGYLIGAKAGHERYEKIARVARTIVDRPEVQGTAGLLQEQATSLAKAALGRQHDPAAHVSPN